MMGGMLDELTVMTREFKARGGPMPIGVRVSPDILEAIAGHVPERPDGVAVGRLLGLDVWVDPSLEPGEWRPVYLFDPLYGAGRETFTEGLKGGR
jgi:hypothetical protein